MKRPVPAAVGWWLVAALPLQAMQSGGIGQLAGTWTLDLGRSTYEGTPAPQRLVMRIEDRGGGLVMARSEAVLPDGRQNTTAAAFKCDGREYPFIVRQERAVPLVVACTATGAGSFEIALAHENGEPLQKTVRTMSDDGRTMTDVVEAVLPDGTPMRVVAVLERQ